MGTYSMGLTVGVYVSRIRHPGRMPAGLAVR